MNYCPDVFCDVCSAPIVGPVYFRGDVFACRECAMHINKFGNWPRYYYALFGFPLAFVLAWLVYLFPLIPIVAVSVSCLAVIVAILSLLMALPH